MNTTERASGKIWAAEEFLETNQHEFGDAWRYELVDGRIISHAAPSPDHGAIVSGLTTALGNRLRGHPDCRPEAGSGAVPRDQQLNTARIPDAMIRCGKLPRVVFEVVSPSELRAWRARDEKRNDLQNVDGVQEIVELYQREVAAHIYRREEGGTWSFEAVGGLNSVLSIKSIGLETSLSEIYQFVKLENEQDGQEGDDSPA